MTHTKRWLFVAAAALLPFITAGCGESRSVTVYKQGQYQGKPDTRPWDGEAFKGDKVAWEKAIKARNNGQNEYARQVAH
jgi:hypothetical protein